MPDHVCIRRVCAAEPFTETCSFFSFHVTAAKEFSRRDRSMGNILADSLARTGAALWRSELWCDLCRVHKHATHACRKLRWVVFFLGGGGSWYRIVRIATPRWRACTENSGGFHYVVVMVTPRWRDGKETRVAFYVSFAVLLPDGVSAAPYVVAWRHC